MSGLDRRGWCGLAVASLIILTTMTPQFRSAVTFPTSIKVPVGESHSLELNLPLPVSVRLRKGDRLKLNNHWLTNKPASVNLSAPFTLESLQPGNAELEFLLFGIPWKRVTVSATLPDRVIPGGHSIGVLLTSKGIIVVGYDNLTSPGGKVRSPGREAGIAPGDLLLEADGVPLEAIQDLAQAVETAGRAGQELRIILKRGDELREVTVKPLALSAGRYRIGLYVRDGANGVGTLSFCDPDTGFFGALGHVITDLDTGTPLMIRDGFIVRALIANITAGARGHPGEKIGVFQPDENILGNIAANTEYGIFGELNSPLTLTNPYFPDPIPVALASEVHPGPAEMYTVLQEDRIERFSVEIERVINQHTPSDKGLILRITDPVLLEKTGGIIQGMSGSPLVQDGKLAGIVTHVFVNDPSRGFGVLAEWMVEKSKLISEGTVSVPSFFGSRMFLPFKEDYGKPLSNNS